MFNDLNEKEMALFCLAMLGVIAFYVVGWTLQSFQANCPNLDQPCDTESQKKLGIASASTFAVAAGLAVLCMLGLGMKYYKSGRGLKPLF